MHIRSLVHALGSVTGRLKTVIELLSSYVPYGVNVESYEQDAAVLGRINDKVQEEIRNGPELVNPKWIGHVVEVAETRVSAGLRLERGFLLNPYVRGLLMSRIHELTKYAPEAHDRLKAEIADFDRVRDEKPINSALRESFLSLVALIEDCEREATIRMVERVFKPAPPAPAKRDRNADRRERDRERRNAMKGKGGQKPARGKKAA